MSFLIHTEVRYTVPQRSTVLLNIHVINTPGQTLNDERFTLHPEVNCEKLLSRSSENRYIRLDTRDATELIVQYAAKANTTPVEVPREEIESIPVADMDQPTLPYLFPSRYCQSDRLGQLVWKEFGDLAHPYQKAAAITNWIHDNVEYIPSTTDSGTSAFNTVTQRAGVCRVAVDTAVATVFGAMDLQRVIVSSFATNPSFTPLPLVGEHERGGIFECPTPRSSSDLAFSCQVPDTVLDPLSCPM